VSATAAARRAFDVAVAAAAAPLVVPLIAVAAVAVALELREWPLYGSPRLGRGGATFRMWRLRTMRPARASSAGLARPELTRVGRVVRDVSLDDAPGLLNVLRGEMSVVGPRPMEPERVDLADPAWREILSVRPGLLSPAILSLGRTYNASDAATKRARELAYVRARSLAGDLRLFGDAVQALVASRGNVKARGAPRRRAPRRGA